MEIRPTYLIFVNGDNNNNKYYNCFPQGDTFKVEYGRVQGGKQTTSYPISKWNSQINSKLKKGYRDVTDLKQDLVEDVSTVETEYKPISNEEIKQIVEKLQALAKDTIKKNYTVTANTVTQAMVDKAQEQIEELANYLSRHNNPDTFDEEELAEFNKMLIKVFGIIPRKMSKVKDYLAQEFADLHKILQREQNLLDTMSSMVYVKPKVKENTEPQKDITILEELGLKIEEVTQEEINHIKQLMNESQDKFRRAWRVTNLKTQERYDKFVKESNIQDTKLLFHGSRSENFWSIIRTGLVLRPTNAVITGKMFGYGIYTSNVFAKSCNYSSINGSYWAQGKDTTGFVALFEVAYGTPYDVYSFNSKYYNLDYNKLQEFQKGATCLHAHSSQGMLRNDEIVVYKEEQVNIKYLIEVGV